MSASDPASFVEWWQNLPIPWLVSGTNGRADATAQGTVVDQQVALVKAATKARMPGQGPLDALDHIGGDRQLERGPFEYETEFRTRLRTAWDAWARAGTALEMLVELYWGGFPGAAVVNQSGLAYQLSAAPTAGADPTSLLVISNLSINPTLSTLPPWWTFDDNPAFCSRFAVILPQQSIDLDLATVRTATATFNGTQDNVTITWSTPFPTTRYEAMPGTPIITDGSGPVVPWISESSKTPTGAVVSVSAQFSGTVGVLGYFYPPIYANLAADDLARLRRLINTWRPARATCVAVYAITSGLLFDWPIRTFSYGGTFAAGTAVTYTVPPI
jgi:hypothetical protein